MLIIMAGIKNIIEVIVAVESGATLYESVFADGKINFKDVPAVISYLSKLKAAVIGADDIPAEIADVDVSEVALLSAATYSAAKEWLRVLKKK